MDRKAELKDLVTRFDNNIAAYKDAKNAYNDYWDGMFLIEQD